MITLIICSFLVLLLRGESPVPKKYRAEQTFLYLAFLPALGFYILRAQSNFSTLGAVVELIAICGFGIGFSIYRWRFLECRISSGAFFIFYVLLLIAIPLSRLAVH